MIDDDNMWLPMASKRHLKSLLKDKKRDIKTIKKSFRRELKPQLAKVRYIKKLIAISK